MKENTFGEYEFEEWVPEHTRQIIRSFWGQMGRNYKDWLENVKYRQRDFCYHGPNPDGFGNPPNGAKAIYLIKKWDGKVGYVLESIEGRYLHRWNNMASLIDAEGIDHTVSSCDMWVRIFMSEEEKNSTPLSQRWPMQIK